MEERTFYNPIIEEMKLKNALHNRIIDMNEDFNEDSCYKLIYYIDKIVNLDKKQNISKDKLKPIAVRINSYGGICYELFNVLSVIEKYKKEGYVFSTYTGGKSMSCGFILFISGDIREVGEFATLLHHSPSSGEWGKVKELEESLEETKRLNNMMKEYILKQTNIPKELLDDIEKYKKDYVFSKEEIEKYNIAKIL